MSGPPLLPLNKNKVLESLSPEVTRLQVVDASGRTCWRKLDELEDLDTIVLHSDGKPITMKGAPGRRKKTDLKPVNANIAEVLDAKSDHLKDDALIKVMRDSPDSDSILDVILQQLAQEAASMEFERLEAERNGRDTSTISLRRANILKSAGDMFLQRKKISVAGTLDLDSPAFSEVFRFMLETFRGAMVDSGMRPELVETTFAKLSKRLDDGWKEEAQSRMRGAK